MVAGRGNAMQCVFNLWLNIAPGSQDTSTVSEQPFDTLARLEKKQKDFHSGTFSPQSCRVWEQPRPPGSQLHSRRGWRLDCRCPPALTPSLPLSTRRFQGEERERAREKTLFFFLFLQSCEEESVRTVAAALQEHCICLWDEKPGNRMGEWEASLPEPGSLRRGRGWSERVHYFPLN